jgi:hypothetical protein
MAHYTIKNFWIDKENEFDVTPRVKRSKNDLSDKPATLSPETHVDKKERVECPVIYVTSKPAKRANKVKRTNSYTLDPVALNAKGIEYSPEVLGDYARDSKAHTCLAGDNKGTRAKYPKKVR